jgi:hypothetical protein
MSNPTHAVVITKPGHGTVRFGPLLQSMAESWRLRLESALRHTTHPEGTTITVEPFDPRAGGGYIDPESIPARVDELMEPFRADMGSDGTGANFPDIYTRLIMRHGDTHGGRLWEQASRRFDEEAAFDQADRDIQKDIAAARAEIAECLDPLDQALRSVQSARATADGFDIGIPAEAAVYPADAAEHLAIALRELRAAGLALQPAKQV